MDVAPEATGPRKASTFWRALGQGSELAQPHLRQLQQQIRDASGHKPLLPTTLLPQASLPFTQGPAGYHGSSREPFPCRVTTAIREPHTARLPHLQSRRPCHHPSNTHRGGHRVAGDAITRRLEQRGRQGP